MKVFVRLYWLIRNFGNLLLELSRENKFYWGSSQCRRVNCSIDNTAVVYGNHALTNVTIGHASYISFNAHISNTTIGKFCSIGPNLVSGWGIHPTNGISTHPAFYSAKKKSAFTLCETSQAEEHRPITVGNDVFVGANVTILDGVTIGDGAVIGAGAVVNKDIPPYAIAVGCPIKIIKYRFSEKAINDLLRIKWWNQDDSVRSNVKKHFYDVENFIKQTN